MGNAFRELEETYQEAYRLGDGIRTLLSKPWSGESLDQLHTLLDRRDACILKAGEAAAGRPQADGGLSIFQNLLDQQTVIEREMVMALRQLRQSQEASDAFRTKVGGAKRMLGFQGASRALDTRR